MRPQARQRTCNGERERLSQVVAQERRQAGLAHAFTLCLTLTCRGLPLFVPTAMAALAAGSWRIFLMPIDTAKTVLQVEGNEGYRSLMRRIGRGELSAFYQGSLATAAAAALGHFPWFYVYTLLNEAIRAPAGWLGKLCRNAFIGFVASLVADTLTNVMRVVKTTKQATASLSSISYAQTVQIILAADGWNGLFGRGLSTRILTNGEQIRKTEVSEGKMMGGERNGLDGFGMCECDRAQDCCSLFHLSPSHLRGARIVLSCTTGLQSIVFTVVWRALSESAFFQSMIESQYEDDDGKRCLISNRKRFKIKDGVSYSYSFENSHSLHTDGAGDDGEASDGAERAHGVQESSREDAELIQRPSKSM